MARDKFYGGKKSDDAEALAEAQAYIDRVRAQRETANQQAKAPSVAKEPKKSTKPGD